MIDEKCVISNLYGNFDEVKPISKGFYAVRKGYRWGVIETALRFISTEDYKAQKGLESITIYKSNRNGEVFTLINNLLVQQDIDLGKPCCIGIYSNRDYVLQSNNKGMLALQCIYDWIWDIEEEKIFFRYKGKKSFIPIQLLPSKYDFIYGFHHGFSIVKLNDKYGVITEKGEEIFPCIYDNLIYSEDRLFRDNYDGQWIVIDKWTLKISYDKYSQVVVLPNNFKKVSDLNGKWGMLDVYNRELVPCIYDELEHKKPPKSWKMSALYNKIGYFEAKIGDEFRIINIDNKITFSGKEKPTGSNLNTVLQKTVCVSNEEFYEYDEYAEYFGYHYFNGCNNRYIDVNDEQSEKYKRVTENAKWGFFDAEGNVIIPVKYEKVARYSNGLFPVKIYRKWGFVNSKNKTIIPFKYDDISPEGFVDGLVAVEIKNKWGFIDIQEQTVINFIYDTVSDFNMGICQAVIENYATFYISKDDICVQMRWHRDFHDYPSSKVEWRDYLDDLNRDTLDAFGIDVEDYYGWRD